MKYRRHFCLCLLIFVAVSAPAEADDCPDSTVYVKSSDNGQYYAKAIPAGREGFGEVTKIYAVREGQDQLLETYQWYSRRVELQPTAWGMSVIRLNQQCGRGRSNEPSETNLALGFYLAGKMLREYSTLDIARLKSGSSDALPYFGILKTNYRWVRSNDYVFDIQTGSEKIISFDVRTGALLTSSDVSSRRTP